MDIVGYLAQPFVWHALLAATLVGIICGLLGPFVVMRDMAFAVHGTSELSFTGAAGGLLLGVSPVAGAFVGSILVAIFIARLGAKARERDSAIGVVIAFGLGVGVLLLSLYHGFATQATNILFGDIFGVSSYKLIALLVIGVIAGLILLFMYRPLLFSSVDPEVAEARGLPVGKISVIFLIILAVTVTEAAQVVGTLLVLSLAITPAAAAQRLSARPTTVTILSVIFALTASVGGLILGLAAGNIKTSVFVTMISFGIYIMVRGYNLKR